MVKLLWVDQNSKLLLFFLHFLTKISFPPRWWSVWSAVTTTGWWWRRSSRSSSSTSSPSSITTPGTLSTLSHVGHLIAYHIKRCRSLPLFIDSMKNTFLTNLWLCIWSKFCSSWYTLHVFSRLFSRRACKLSTSWRPNIFHRSLLGQEICMVRKKINIIEEPTKGKSRYGYETLRYYSAHTEDERMHKDSNLSNPMCNVFPTEVACNTVVLFFHNPLVHVSSSGGWTLITLTTFATKECFRCRAQFQTLEPQVKDNFITASASSHKYDFMPYCYAVCIREGIKKNRLVLGKSPKLWVGGGQES